MAEVRSEDVYGKKWDRCLSDTSIKVVGGIGVGIIFSVTFFKRKPWPLLVFGGMGLGMGYANCQHDFQNANLFHGTIQKAISQK